MNRMCASLMNELCELTGAPRGERHEADVTVRVMRREQYEVWWRRWSVSGGWSEYRTVVGPSLLDALAEAFAVERTLGKATKRG